MKLEEQTDQSGCLPVQSNRLCTRHLGSNTPHGALAPLERLGHSQGAAPATNMPDIDPAALSRSDSVTIANPSSLSLKQVNGIAALPSQKTPKTVSSAQRIDLEPLYTSLKAAIGDNWGTYKDALSLFILGKS